jgi:hypothetical protein
MAEFVFRMKQLPKNEYRLMSDLIKHLGLDDPSELFTILLRVGYEVISMEHVQVDNGERYVRDIVNQWRSFPLEERTYQVGD